MTDLTGMNPADRHRAAAATFAQVAEAITDWDAQTPVPEWKARDVVAHLVEWLPGFLESTGVRLEGAPADAASPVAAFAQLSASVQAVLDAPDAGRVLTTSMFGDKPLNEMIDQFYTADVFMHTWDLARSGGIEAALDPAFAGMLHGGLEAMGPMLQESGQFGTPVPVPDDADPVTSLVGFIGRDPDFRA